MKKNTFILFIIGLLVLVGCGKKVTEYTPKLQNFFYSYSKNGVSCDYNITTSTNKVVLNASGNTTNCNINEIILDESQIEKLEKIIDDNKLKEWNNFKEQGEYVSNGEEFSIQIGYDSGENIFAYGYMEFPDNYQNVHNELIKLFEEIK